MWVFFISGRRDSCLARSRLTAIPCFAYRFSIFGKSTPASARSRNPRKAVSRPRHPNKKEAQSLSFSGAGDGTRTRDILLGKQTFYH